MKTFKFKKHWWKDTNARQTSEGGDTDSIMIVLAVDSFLNLDNPHESDFLELINALKKYGVQLQSRYYEVLQSIMKIDSK